MANDLGSLISGPIVLPNPAAFRNAPGAPAGGLPPLPTPDPQGQPSGAPQDNVSGWETFLTKLSTDTAMQRSLLAAGAQMLQPRAPGQSQAGAIGQGIQAGTRAFDKQKDRELAQTTAQAHLNIQQQGADAASSQAASSAKNADTSQTTAEQRGQLIDPQLRVLEQELLATTFANTPEQLALRDQEIKARIASLTRAPQASGEMQLLDRFISIERNSGDPDFDETIAARNGLEYLKKSRTAPTAQDAFEGTLGKMISANPLAFTEPEAQTALYSMANLSAALTAERLGEDWIPINPATGAAFSRSGLAGAQAETEGITAQGQWTTWRQQGIITDTESERRALLVLKKQFPTLPKGWTPDG